jgi:uncharacterized membrane protein YgcG
MLVFLGVLVAPIVAAAVGKPTFPAPPQPGHVISDTAGLVGGGDGSEIDRLAAALLAEKGYPISVVTIRSLATQGASGYTIERYAAELMQSSTEERFRTHGMLLLVAAEDRAARIHLGSAWGSAHDDRARKVMTRLILPAFRRSDFSAGIIHGVRGLDAMGRQLPLPVVGQPQWMPSALVVEELGGPWWTLPAVAAGVILSIIGGVSLLRRGRRGWAWAIVAFVFGVLLARFFGSAEAGGSEGGATGSW